MSTIIDTLIERHERICAFLDNAGEISLRLDVEDEFRKVLVLCIASFFESEITNAISLLAQRSQSECIISLIRSKVVARQYHTYFDWNSKNINKFLSLFGEYFRDTLNSEIKGNVELNEGMKDFIVLGQQRNVLVHENFASANLNWTTEEIVQKYRSAQTFVSYLAAKIENQLPLPNS